MKKFSKKLVTTLLAAVMVLAMGVTAFAAEGDITTLSTSLYKDGQYDASSPSSNLSMGDGAVLDTTYEELEDGTYLVTVNFSESFKAYGITSHLTNVELDLDGNGSYDEEEDVDYFLINGESDTSAVVGYSFVTTAVPTSTIMYDAQFTIEALKMPIEAEGDLYIFPAS